MITIFIAGISLGILGSFHCIGMCGPIALALPIHKYNTLKKYLSIFVYNLGRAITYSVLGFLFGLLGETFFLGGIQQNFSIFLGVVLLGFVLFTQYQFISPINFPFLNQRINKLKTTFASLLGKKGFQFLFAIGLLNGLLPCGFVYMALAGALTSGTYLNGALFMFFFGLGTMPIMFLLMIFGQFISIRYRKLLNQAVPIVITIMGILLIARGLNLGIPFVSPEMKQEIVTTEATHKKHTVVRCCVNPKSDSLKVMNIR